MFFRLYKYSMLQTTRQRLIMFWNLIFPIILGTLFQMVFGNFTEEEITFHQIPVAYVAEEGADTSFTELLELLEEDSKLIKVETVGREEAKKLLKEEKVEGIYYNGRGTLSGQEGEDSGQEKEQGISLTVTGQNITQSILSTILEQYERTAKTLANIGQEHPEGLEKAASLLEKECQYLKEGGISDTPKSAMMDFFYSLIAMNCLMGGTVGMMSAVNFKADLSDLAARRVVASTNRFGILLADLAAKITVQFLCTTFSACYLMYVLHVSVGNKFGWILLTVFVGSIVGIVLGFFIGVIGKLRENVKEPLCIGIMLVSSFFSGLMVPTMYRIVETYAPVIHRINPASLIVKALYSLDIYETYGRYMQCMVSLLILTILLGAGAFVIVRRERYASI